MWKYELITVVLTLAITIKSTLAVNCPKNEQLDQCPSSCPPRTCATKDILYKCVAPLEVGDPKCPAPTCRCKDGFYRNKEGNCVTKEQCGSTPKCPKNEVLDLCLASCPPRTCATKDIQVKCIAPLEVGDPKCPAPTCRCKDGFYRNDEGNCVTKEQCGSTPVCPQNQVYDWCPNPCPPRKCNTSDIQFNCLAGPTYPDPACPSPVCRCGDGFYKNDQDNCVTKAECNNCVKANEVWDSCAPSSPPQTCDYLNGYQKVQTKSSKSKCIAECRCQEGYYRNFLEDCITKAHCLECSGPNEFWSCGGACDNVCETLSVQNQTTCPIINIKCNEMCYCKDGYARNSKGICVPFAKCETQKTGSKAPKRTTRAATAVQCSSEDVQTGTSNFAKGNAQFSTNFYSELSKEQSNQSTIASPYSLLFLLAQLVLYTTGVSYDQLIAALGLQNKDQVRCTFPALLDAIASQNDVTFDLATKVYSNVGNPLSESYKTDSKDVFRSEAETLDFSQSEQAAQTINSWVAQNTNNKINDLIPASALSAMTRLVLVNALYFNGLWQKSFNKNSTIDSPFYVSSTQTKNVPTMTQKNNFFYVGSDTLECQILSMPYTGGKFSFVLFVPNEQDGLSALQEKMKDVSVVEAAVSSATNVSITVYIPKFTITTTIDLTQLLSQIGITQIFNQTDSGISGLLQNPEDVYVSAAIQKAFIDVSEEGTEATAANAIMFTALSAIISEEPLTFRADRPFAYQIRFSDTPIFTGSYYGN